MKSNKKIAVLIGDGMSDYPIEELGGKTPLEAAKTPNMDELAGKGTLGMVRTVPDGMDPGSDTANLSIFGSDPRKDYTGRAPLEAINMGIDMGENDVALRCNIVTIGPDGTMEDFSGGHIETAFTRHVIEELAGHIGQKNIALYPGVSYRNILIWKNFPYAQVPDATPPHDIQGRNSNEHLPDGEGADYLIEIMDRAKSVIEKSKIIADAKSKYRGNPTGIWLWGGGKKPTMESLPERMGLHGYTISAVDLIHGIGRAIGLEPWPVEGATGYIDTNYAGKADALIEAFDTANFVFLHVESPDESGHEGNLKHKLQAIEDFDKQVVGNVMKRLEMFDDYVLLVMPDHPTPLSLRTHTAEPVPFCIYSSDGAFSGQEKSVAGYNEIAARATGLFVEEGHRLIEIMARGYV